MSDTPAEESAQLDDRATLHRLGYAQELYRSMGGFQNFAISFTIISILAGCLTSYYIGFSQGGPVAITWGWLIVGVACTFVAMAMGEIASTYPTAGGLYFWASKLGGPGWGWFTGWFNLIGQIAVTAAIGFGCAIFMTSLFNLWWSYPNSFGWIYFLYGIIMLSAGLINMFKVSITAVLNTFSAWWHMVGVLVLVAIMIIVPDHHQSFHYVFGQTINNTGLGGTTTHGFIYAYVFLTGLLLAQYTITGYDASAHMSEETRSASLGAAWGMVMSVVVSVVFGFILLVAVTFVIPAKGPSDVSAFIVQSIWTDSLGTKWAEFLIFVAVVAQCFCTIASTTSASRMMFAFSRDRAVPGHQLWKRVSKRDRIPVYTVWAICCLSFLTPLPALWWGFVGYYAATAVAVIGLYIAFVIPIILRLRGGRVVRAHGLEPRQVLQDRRLDRDRLDLRHLPRLHAPGLSGWHSVQVELRLELLQLHAAPGLRGVPALRRLVRPQRAEVVQGPGASGHGRRACSDRGRFRGAGSSGDLARGRGVVTRSNGGRASGPPAVGR